MTDAARNVADALADKLTDTILARYQGDQTVTKQADPTGRPTTPAALDKYQPTILNQALIELARAEGRADGLAETISDLQLDRTILTDKLIDAERDHANALAAEQTNTNYLQQQYTQLQQMLASATAKVDALQAENSDLHRVIDESAAGIANLPAAAAEQALDRIGVIARTELTAHYEATAGGDPAEPSDDDIAAVRELAHELAQTRHTAEQRLRESEQIEAIASTALLAYYCETEGRAIKHTLPGTTTAMVAALADELHRACDRMIQLGSANEALQDSMRRHPAGRHIVVQGEGREHTEPAPVVGTVPPSDPFAAPASVAEVQNDDTEPYTVSPAQWVDQSPAEFTRPVSITQDSLAGDAGSPNLAELHVDD